MHRVWPVAVALTLMGCGTSAVREALDALDPTPSDRFTGPELLYGTEPETLMINAQRWMVLGESGDDVCPRREISEGGNRVVYRGGCADRNGAEWYGDARFDYPDQTDWGVVQVLDFRSDGFGFMHGNGLLSEVTGRARIRDNGTIDVELMSWSGWEGETTRMIYAFEAEFVEVAGGLRWNLEGEIGYDALGRIRLETVDLVRTEACALEPESGTTTVKWADGNEASVTFDGAEACDGLATWSLNGEEIGLMNTR